MNWLDTLLKLGVDEATAGRWAPVFNKHCQPEAFSKGFDEIDDFLGQVLHESGMLTRLSESLNYKAATRIQQVWPSRFKTAAEAQPFVMNPRALANKVYGGRMGNAGPDDGWNYRGRGLIQVTGRDNYAAVSKVLGIDLVKEPDLLSQPMYALLGAIAWWEGNIPDEMLGDIVKVTKRVNGGTIGLAHRQEMTEKAREGLA